MSMFSSKTDTTESSAKDLDRVRLAKQKKPKKTKEKAVRKVARTVQDTIPYEHVHGKYIFEVEKNRYSVTYAFSDVTYDAADAAEQERIFLAYGDLLNSFDTSDDIQITLHNNVINQKEFSSQILLKHAGDGFDEYRDEYNEMLLDKMQQGQNGITTKKYFTVTVTAATLELAQQKLAAKELYMRSCFQKIGSNIEKLKANERIRIIAEIFRGVNQEIRPISSSEFLRGAEKSLCCPDYFEFKKDYFMYNDKFARMVYLKHLPSSLVDDMLKDLCETSLPIVVTVNIAPVEPSEAIKVVKRQLTAMRSNKMQKEKKASQHGVYSDVISDDLKQSLAEAEELLNDLQSKNQKMFLLNLVVMVTGTSFDELDNNTDKIEAVFRKHVCTTSRANFQQEDAMASCLPLGNCRLKVRRTLTTESACVFMPFNSKELSQKGGVYYGLNQTTNNLIIFNRASLINANGFILGCPGSGKSFSAKREICNAFLVTDDDILVCDPESEYAPLVERLHGQVIHISPSSTQYINPMDINSNYSEEDNPLALKADFILSLCELVVGGKEGLQPVEKTVIDRCVHVVYRKYFENPTPENMPLLEDLYNALLTQDEPEARHVAAALEIYVKGSLNIFNHHTNVDIHNRIVCFDIKQLGKQLKKLGMLIVQDAVWGRVTANRSAGKSTRYYADEFHLLLKEEQTAAYSVEIWKRFRKWGGIPTALTQNVKDLLASPEVSNIFENSDFVYMLNQANGDRQILAKQLNISPHQLSYVTHSGEGEGLLFFGNVILPFVDHFPKDLELYRILTTKLNEISEGTQK